MTPITEGLPVLPPAQAQPPAIITKQCSMSWLAWFGNDPCNTESGLTEAEAVFALILEHPELFGTVQRLGEGYE